MSMSHQSRGRRLLLLRGSSRLSVHGAPALLRYKVTLTPHRTFPPALTFRLISGRAAGPRSYAFTIWSAKAAYTVTFSPPSTLRTKRIRFPASSEGNITLSAVGESGTLFACIERSQYADKRQLVVLSRLNRSDAPIPLRSPFASATEFSLDQSASQEADDGAGPSDGEDITLTRHVVVSGAVSKVIRTADKMVIDEGSGRICLGSTGSSELVLVDPFV